MSYTKYTPRQLLEIRFWSKVRKAGEDDCWEWLAYKTPKGYGSFSFGRRARFVFAHRAVFFLTNGRWPLLQVLHSCDNPSCVNPKHLREGTQAENMREASQKGRLHMTRPWMHGERNHQSVLTWPVVEQIRLERRLHNTSFVKLAKKFGVGRTTIEHVLKFRTWPIPRLERGGNTDE